MTALPAQAERQTSLAQRARQVAIPLLLAAALAVAQLVAEGHDQQRLTELVFLGAAVALLPAASRWRALRLPAGATQTGALLLFFMLGIVSSLRAASPVHAVLEVALWWLLLCVALAGAADLATDDGSGQLLVLQVLGAGIGVYCLKVLAVAGVAVATRSTTDLSLFAPSFSNYRFLNHGQTITLPLLALLCLQAPRSQRWIWYGIAACWWSLLILLGGRGTAAGLVLGGMAALALMHRHSWPLLRMLAISALSGAVLYLCLFVALPIAAGMPPFGSLHSELGRTLADPGSGRGFLWQAALAAIPSHPWLGAGPMHYAHELAGVVTFSHPHDWVLQIAHEWGLPALISLCLTLTLALRVLARAGQRLAPGETAGQAMLTTWIVTGVAILADGLVSGLIVMPVSQLGIVLYLSLAGGWVRGGRSACQSCRPALAVSALLALLLVVGAAHRIYSVADSAETFRPRFWMHGQF